jgi:hypothetical protein
VLILEFGQVIHILVDDDVEIVWLVVRCHLAGGECLPHCHGDVMLVSCASKSASQIPVY